MPNETLLLSVGGLCALGAGAYRWTGSGQRPAGSNGGVVQSSRADNTKQENEAWALNVPTPWGTTSPCRRREPDRLGRDVAAPVEHELDHSDRRSGRGGWSTAWSSRCGCDKSGGEKQSVGNETKQENEAGALNVPIASGNNVALVNGGNKSPRPGRYSSRVRPERRPTRTPPETVRLGSEHFDSCGCGPEGKHFIGRDETKEEKRGAGSERADRLGQQRRSRQRPELLEAPRPARARSRRTRRDDTGCGRDRTRPGSAVRSRSRCTTKQAGERKAWR